MTGNAEIITQKQRNFCNAFVETGNASEAYRRAYSTDNMSAESIKVEASRLLDNPNVSLTVEELRKQHAERHNVTVDSITKELEEARIMSMTEKQLSTAVSATMGKAKLHGLLIDKSDNQTEVTVNFTKTVKSAKSGD